jgi:hypothetical protein
MSSDWQLTINSTVHRLNVQYRGCDTMHSRHQLMVWPLLTSRRHFGFAKDTLADDGEAKIAT